MKQEEKDLLLKDLCARLPYGTIVVDDNGNKMLLDYKGTITNKKFTDVLSDAIDEYKIKPYLRPMSSMTEEEVKELAYKILLQPDLSIVRNYKKLDIDFKYLDKFIEWINAHHFDYRGLIEKGLALESPEDMYKFD